MTKLLKFYGTYCAPCKQLHKIIESAQLPVPVENICIEDADDEILTKYQIKGVPVLILLDENENVLWKHVGMISADQLIQKINDHVSC